MNIEEEVEDYGFDLCSSCRDCGYVCGKHEPCQHLIDAKHGYKDGYEKGFSDACELAKNNETKETANPIKTNNSEFDDFFNGDVHLHKMLKTPEKTEIGKLLKYAFEAGCKRKEICK